MKDGHAGVAIGSEVTGGCRNVWVENCTMDSPELDRIIRIKSNAMRGGEVENIFIRNIRVGECKESILGFELKYWHVDDGPYLPYFTIFIWKISQVRKVSMFCIWMVLRIKYRREIFCERLHF